MANHVLIDDAYLSINRGLTQSNLTTFVMHSYDVEVQYEGSIIINVKSIRKFNNEYELNFHPNTYLDLIVLAHFNDAEKHTNAAERLRIVLKCKHFIITTIKSIKRVMAANGITENSNIDPNDVLEEISAAITSTQIELDIAKYDLEVEKLSKENKFFTYPLLIALLALAISVIPYIDKWFISGSDKSDVQKIMLIPAEQTKPQNATKLPIENTDSPSEKPEVIP